MRLISIPLGMPTVGALPCSSNQWSAYSFLLRRQTTLYNRRQAKIVSTLTSYFTSCYVFHWSRYFPDTTLRYPPSFDGRIVLYPTHREVRDYFAWRQADSKILSLWYIYAYLTWSRKLISITCTTPCFGLLYSKAVKRRLKPTLHYACVIWFPFMNRTLRRVILGNFIKG